MDQLESIVVGVILGFVLFFGGPQLRTGVILGMVLMGVLDRTLLMSIARLRGRR